MTRALFGCAWCNARFEADDRETRIICPLCGRDSTVRVRTFDTGPPPPPVHTGGDR